MAGVLMVWIGIQLQHELQKREQKKRDRNEQRYRELVAEAALRRDSVLVAAGEDGEPYETPGTEGPGGPGSPGGSGSPGGPGQELPPPYEATVGARRLAEERAIVNADDARRREAEAEKNGRKKNRKRLSGKFVGRVLRRGSEVR